LLIDTEVGPKENDREMWSYLDHWGLPYQIIGTKADKASTEQRQKLEEDFAHLASCHGAMHPHLLLTSARKDEGIVRLQTTILREIVGR
jgi:GTP-binding protein